MTNQTDRNAKSPPGAAKNQSSTGTAKTSGSSPGSAESPPLPKTWDDIKIGSLVIAHETIDYGRRRQSSPNITDDMLTLRWRDYPRQAAISRARYQVALLFPGK